MEEFYSKLYTSTTPKPKIKRDIILNVGSEEIPPITHEEIIDTLKLMKNRKCPGEDRITIEMLRMGGETLIEAIQILLNKCLEGDRFR